MQPFTIIRETNTVVCGGAAFEVDCSALPAEVHAVQWDGTHGEVEYRLTRCTHCGARSKKGNEAFTDAAQYQPYIDGWQRAMEAEQARLKAEAEAKAAEMEQTRAEHVAAAAAAAQPEGGTHGPSEV